MNNNDKKEIINLIDDWNAISFYELNEHSKECYYEIRNAILAMPIDTSQEPCEDAISRWIPVTDKLPSDCDEDWVLVQIQEDNGYLWIPRVMEYRKSKDDWWGEDIGWLKNNNGAFKVIAWMPLPKPFEPQERSE